MKKIFTPFVLIIVVLILMSRNLYAVGPDSLTCTVYVYPKASVGCHAYVSYGGNASTNAIFVWNFDGGTIMSGSGRGPYYIIWDTVGYKTVTVTVTDGSYTCSAHGHIHIVPAPTIYNVTGGGSYPQGGGGVHIYLSGSQLNYNYYIYLNGNNSPVTNKTGTGSQLDFGLFTAAGVYKVKGKVDSSSSSCLVYMADSAIVSISGYVAPQYICIVTYDTASQHNKVIWNKYTGQHIVHYNIYRQTYIEDQYIKIGEVPFTSFSTYIDTAVNPVTMPYKYEITGTDTVGGESPKSPFHKTVHLQVSPGVYGFNLSWNPYEGFTFSTYRIHRKINTGPWETIDSVASDVNSYTDPYVTSGLAYYYIEVIRYYPCYPSLKEAYYLSSVSNIGMSYPLGVDEISGPAIMVYPNPASNILHVILPGSVQNQRILELYSMDGRKLISQNILSSRNEIDISGIPSGIYFLRIRDEQNNFVKKIIKE